MAHVVVTGGSSGIGLEVAKIYVNRGASVSLIGRDVERLQAARQALEVYALQARIFTASANVAIPEEVQGALKASEAAHGPCDILVASAGVVEPGWFHEQEDQARRTQWETNFVGVANAMNHVLPIMRQRGGGNIMIVSSSAAFIGIPAYASYCASKAALVGFADALRLEAVHTGVTIGICFPPDTDTPQLERERMTRPAEAEMLMGCIRAWPASEVADKIVRGIDKKKARVYFDLSIAALAMLGPMLRPWVERWYTLRTSQKNRAR